MWVSDVTCERSSYCIFDFDLYFCSLLAALSKSLHHLPLGSFMLFQVVYHNVLCQILQKFLFLWHILSFDNAWILLFDNVGLLLDFCWFCVHRVLFVCVHCYMCEYSFTYVLAVLFLFVQCYLHVYIDYFCERFYLGD